MSNSNIRKVRESLFVIVVDSLWHFSELLFGLVCMLTASFLWFFLKRSHLFDFALHVQPSESLKQVSPSYRIATGVAS